MLVLPALIALVMFAVAYPSLVVEDARSFHALGRSWRLVRGNVWRTIGTLLLSQMPAFVVFIGASLLKPGDDPWWYVPALSTAVLTLGQIGTVAATHLYAQLRGRERRFDREQLRQELADHP